jgi:tRNA(fMet)-specific endonuclease VapC
VRFRLRGSRKLRRELDALYTGLEVIAYDLEAARRYGRLAAMLLDEGVPIGVEDTMIAAQALSRGLTLVTHNRKHFDRVRSLRLEDWF